MKGFTRRRRALGALAALVGGVGLAALPATPASAVPVENVCFNSATADPAQLTADLTGTVPATLNPGQAFQSTNMGLNLGLPGAMFVAGYNLGLLNNGQMISGTVTATVTASNTVEGQQTTNAVTASLGPLAISDPDGVRGSGDEVADPVAAIVSFNNMSWTAGAGGPVTLREAAVPITNASGGGGVSVDANMGFTVRFRCSPGTLSGTTPNWTTAAPFATSQIVVPEAAPVAVNDTASVGANQATSINVLANDTDANGNIDESSVTIVDAPTAGTAVANPDGSVTYTNTSVASTDSFTYTVDDDAGGTSNVATVNINVLGDTCDATTAACSLDQIVEVQVNGAAMSMQQAGSLITLQPITLNGQPQQTSGAINGLTVVNARGTDAGWSLTGQLTSDFSDGVCPANNPSTWDNHCIPGANAGWVPSASVAHVVIPGDVAAVNPGPPLMQGGLDQASTLCSAPANRSGGTFECGGGIGLGIPASAAAGLYRATLTLTLV